MIRYNIRNRSGRRVEIVIDGNHGLPVRRLRNQLDRGLGQNGQRTARSYQQSGQIVPCGVLHQLAACAQDAPVRQYSLQAEYVILGRSILQAAQATSPRAMLPPIVQMIIAWIRRIE